MNRTGTDEILRLQPGAVLVSLVGNPPQVVFQVRERSAVIKYLGSTGIELRAGLFPVDKAAPVAVLIRVGQYVTNEYITWWDFHRPGFGERFQAMTVQDHLPFHFYGDNTRQERLFLATTLLKRFFAEALHTIAPLQLWSPADFAAAQEEVITCRQPLWEAAVSS